MARMPDARWRPISTNYNEGGCFPRVVILHIMIGTLAGTDSWFRNSGSRVSSHFGTGKDGTIYQWVDTEDRAWANAGANSYAISIENEGQSGDALTDGQIEACARILAWASGAHGIDLRVNDSVSSEGLSYHNMSSSWSLGGTSCPGSRIVAQRGEIVQRAVEIAGGSPPKAPPPRDPEVPHNGMTSVRSYLDQQKGVNYARYLRESSYRALGRIAEDNEWGPQTYGGVRELQRVVGVGDDGKWGPVTEAAYGVWTREHKKAAPAPTKPEPLEVDGVMGPETVRALQRYLKVAEDGILGPVTVRALQAHLGVQQDGDWGPVTTKALQRRLNEGTF